MRNSNLRWVILLGAVTILSIIAMQTYWLTQRWSHETRSFDQTTKIALSRVAHKMATINKSTLPSGEVIKKITPNYYIVNFSDVIDANILESLLLAEFSSQTNYTDFEYAIYDCSSDDMVYGNHCNLIESDKPTKSEGTLPKYDEFNYYFGVKFPSRQEDMRANTMSSWLMALIAAITVIFFSYTIWVIFNQRRYSEMQRDFINNMTHEFKTPIATISLAVDAMRNEKVINDRQKLSYFSGIIKEENQRMNRQVETILKASQLEKQEVDLNMKPVHVHEVIKDVVDNFTLQLEDKKGRVELSLNAPNDLIEADEVHFSNLVNNLVDNAVKYAKDNTPPVIKLITSSNGKNFTVKIEDNGIGMNRDTVKRIFERFYRAHTGNVHNVKGFGLGLSYVKTVVEAHNGDIKAESTLGKGSSFTIELPLKKA